MIPARRPENALPSTRILVADDYEAWRRQVCLLLQGRPDLQVICAASDGEEAVQKSKELKPDLILLDIGLPKLNGIEAARQIRRLSANSKIIFLSQNNSPDIVKEALSTGARAFVFKTEAATRLLPAVDAVLRSAQSADSQLDGAGFNASAEGKTACRHEVQFYSEDAVFLDSFTGFIAFALKAGNGAIVIATKSHLDGLIQRLEAEGLDIDGAIRQGTYIALDADDSLSAIMVNGLPDPARFMTGLSDLIEASCRAATADHPRVAFCGERVGLLWADGKTDAAIRLEQLCNELTETYEVDILCAYPLSSFRGKKDGHDLICSEHTASFSR